MRSLQDLQTSSIEQAISHDSVPIAFISGVNGVFNGKEVSGTQITLGIITYFINRFLKFVNVGKSMNVEQVKMTAEMILSNASCRNLKPADYHVFFNKLAMAEYGPLYDRVDGQYIFEKLQIYIAERADTCEAMALRAHIHQKENDAKQKFHPKAIETLSAIAKEIKPTTVAHKSKAYQTSERDKFLKQCLTDFDKLYFDQGKEERFLKTVTFEGLELGQTEYLELRAKQYDLNQKQNK